MKVIRALVAVLVGLVLVACGGGGGGGGGGAGGSSTISGVVTKGPLAGATLVFFSLNSDGSKKAQIGTVVTDGQGRFSATLDPAPDGPFLGEATNGSYVDEVSGTTVMLYGDDILRAVMPAGTTSVTISPLTHIAASRALALAAGGTPLATAVASSNRGVATQFGIADPLHTIPVAANLALQNTITTRDQRLYSLVLAGLAQEASDLGVRAIDLADALAADAADGLLDGQVDGTLLSVPTFGSALLPLPATAGTSGLRTAITAFAASAANQTAILDVPMPQHAVPIGSPLATTLAVDLPVLPTATVLQPYSAHLTATGGTPPYTCALESGALPTGFSLATDTCQLTGTGTATPSLSAPFTVRLNDSTVPPASVDFIDLQFATLAAGPTLSAVPAAMTRLIYGAVTVAEVSGGTSPYYVTGGDPADGTPPTGTSLWPDGTLRGTPTAVGEFTFPVCAVDLVGAEDCRAASVSVVEPDAVGLLDVTLAGNGLGSVQSTPAGLDCGTNCSAYFPQGVSLTLTPKPDARSLFTGWSGACSGTGNCVLLMGESENVTATFDLAPGLYVGTFNVSGTVSNLQNDCVFNVNVGGTITLHMSLGQMVGGEATVTGTADVSGRWANNVASGSGCVSGNDAYSTTGALIGTNLGFTSAAGTAPQVALEGVLSGTTVTGTVTVSSANTSGNLVSAFTLTKQ